MTENSIFNSIGTVDDENLFDEQNFDNVEQLLNDIFDILNHDDNDELENILEEYNQDFDFDYINTNVDNEEMINEDDNSKIVHEHHDNKIVDEQNLSQKLSQLSTKNELFQDNNEDDDEHAHDLNKKRQLSTPSTPNIISKKLRSIDDDDDNDGGGGGNDDKNQKDVIPVYLQVPNKIFDKILIDHIICDNTINTITKEDLRQLTILKHKIVHINLRKKLWSIYLQSGIGQWKTLEISTTTVDRRFWSPEVKQMVLLKLHTMKLNEKEREDNEHKLCQDIVHEYLQKLTTMVEQYQNEYEQNSNALIGYTDEIEKAIEILIQQHSIPLLQMKFNYKITMLKYDSNAKLLEREYLQLKPTNDQIQMARRLYNLQLKYSKSKQELIELKQRILCNKATKLMTPTLSYMDSMTNENVLCRRQQQEQLSDSTIASIIQAQDTIEEYQQLFNEEILQLSVMNKNENQKESTEKLIYLIYERMKIIDKKVNYMYNFKRDYFLRTHDGNLEDQLNRSNISFSPTMIIDTSLLHQLTDEQLRLLNRGPTYVPPCQMYVSSSYISINDMIQKQYKLLQHYLSILFAKCHVNTTRSMFINKEIKDLFTTSFSLPLPSPLYQRTLYETNLVHSIRQHLKMNNLILRRTADQRNVFYLGNMKDFQDKANDYLIQTDDAFEIIEIIDNNNNLQQTHEYLIKLIKSIHAELEIIFKNKKIHKDILDKLHIDKNKVQLPYLYFLPDVSKKNSLTVKPVIVSQYSATSRLAQFLDELLRPMIQRYTKSTRFINGADFIRKLNEYTTEDKHHYFQPTTSFVTMKITNFNTMVAHGIMLIALQDYLNDHLAIPSIDNLSVNKIVHLTALFLNYNRFYYDNKIYRFKKGGPTNILLCETLCNIYIYQWEMLLLKELDTEQELYGRCKNQVFFTWNRPVNEFQQLLHTINSKYPNIQLEIIIDSKNQFLNAQIENLDGILYSCVYHDPNIQKYTLPYVFGDATVAHSHWFRSALIRAVRYCTSVFDFNQEQIYLEITCLANGYSLEFVEQRLNHFYIHFDAISLRSSLDQLVYDKLRHRLFNFISEQNYFSKKNQELEKINERIRLSYLYQFGPKQKFNKKLQEILSKNLNTSAATTTTTTTITPQTSFVAKNNEIKIILTTKQQYSLNALLSQQKPVHQLLNKEKTIF